MKFEEWVAKLGCVIRFDDEATKRTAMLFASMAYQAATEAANTRWIPASERERMPVEKSLIAIYDPENKTWYRHQFFPEDGLPTWATHWFELPELPE